MKYVNIAVCAVMVLFAAVQYNDPDAALWIVIYLIPALWAALAAFRPRALGDTRVFAALCASVLAAVAGTAYYWPDSPEWWRRDVWWEVETAREGMGMMVVTAGLLIALVTSLRGRTQGRPPLT